MHGSWSGQGDDDDATRRDDDDVTRRDDDDVTRRDDDDVTRRDDDARHADFRADASQEAAGSDVAVPRRLANYDLVSELGRGGMGVVHLAVDRRLKRSVALKVISGEAARLQDEARFRREAETIARLQHPGIVGIHEIGEARGRTYIALELVRGGSLRDLIGPAHDPRWAAAMMLQVARAVDVAHRQGIVHRDLKPANVLLAETHGGPDGSGQVSQPSADSATYRVPGHWLRSGSGGPSFAALPLAKVADFGLAKQVSLDSDLTQTEAFLGTPSYMAPEQADRRTREVGPATDVHALGAILHELLTGRRPFGGEDLLELVRAIREDEATPVRELRREVPRDLETIVSKCLQPRPGDRYPTAGELADDLERFLTDEPILARPLGPVGRAWRWARQRPVVAGTLAAAAGLYTFHLLAFYVARHETAQRVHGTVTIGLSAWCAVTWWLDRFANSARWHAPARIGQLVATIGIGTVMAMLADGPRSPPMPVFLVMIVASALILPRPTMVWAASVATLVAYAAIIAHASLFAPENAVEPEQSIGFVVAIVLTGVTMHLLLRRIAPHAASPAAMATRSAATRPGAPAGIEGSRRP